MANIGEFYDILKVPMRLYWDSNRAAIRNTTNSGWVQQTGKYKVINVAWTDANGGYYSTEPASGGIALYAINDITNSYAIGWIRSDDNIAPVAMRNVPTQIDPESASYPVTLSGIQGISYTYTVTVGSTEVYSSSRTLTYPSTNVTIPLSTFRSKLYSALGSASSGTVTHRVKTYYESKLVGETTATSSVVIANDVKPRLVSIPIYTLVEPYDGKLYQNMSAINVSYNPADIEAGTGATITQIVTKVGDATAINQSNWTSPKLNQSGTIVASVTAIDSRGRETTHYKTFTVEPYVQVNVESFVAKRLSDERMQINLMGRYSPIVGDMVYIDLHYRLRGQTTWRESIINREVAGSSGRYTLAIAFRGLSGSSSYDIRATIRDASGVTATALTVLGTQAVPLSLGKYGAGVGKVIDNTSSYNLQVGSGGIDSEGPIRMRGAELTDLIFQAVNEAVSRIQPTDPQPSETPIQSNANGKWLKRSDGHTLAWGTISGTSASSYTINYPVTFKSAPNIVVTPVYSDRWGQVNSHIQTNSTTQATGVVMTQQQALNNFQIHWQAIGEV